MPTNSIERLTLEAHGLRFHALAAGPVKGPLVMLLHGFPDFSFGFRHQMAPLAAAGYRVVAPDQRGFGQSDKPAGRDAYRLDLLADDVQALVAALGRKRYAVVGHDWGGAVAWHLASRLSPGLDRIAILNAPHPGTVGLHTLMHPTQALKGWYMAFFQLPAMPEWLLARDDYALLRNALVASSLDGSFTPLDLASYREAWRQPGAMTGMLNWYRAPMDPLLAKPRIGIPVRILWGDRDVFLDRALAERGAEVCERAEVTHFPEASHWVHREEVDQVNAALIEFLR